MAIGPSCFGLFAKNDQYGAQITWSLLTGRQQLATDHPRAIEIIQQINRNEDTANATAGRHRQQMIEKGESALAERLYLEDINASHSHAALGRVMIRLEPYKTAAALELSGLLPAGTQKALTHLKKRLSSENFEAISAHPFKLMAALDATNIEILATLYMNQQQLQQIRFVVQSRMITPKKAANLELSPAYTPFLLSVVSQKKTAMFPSIKLDDGLPANWRTTDVYIEIDRHSPNYE